MLCMVALVPFLMIIFGAVFVKFPPEDINAFYGYRTRNSMRNQGNWDFAQRYWGRCALYTGCVGFVPAVLCMLPCLGKPVDTVGSWGAVVCVVLGAVVIGLPVFLTERKLRRR